MSRASDIINRAAHKPNLATRRAFLQSAGAGGLVLALARARKAHGAIFGFVGGAESGAFSGFYPAGHWVPAVVPFTSANQAAVQIYPRPDTETNTYARHRWAYYDGTNPVEYRIPVGVRGGSYPYVFTLLSGPPGMSIPAPYYQPGWTFAQALAAGYGDIVWTPSAALGSPATVQVQVTDQAGASIIVEWTVSTSSSTSQFVFLDPVNGVDTNSGTIGSPIKTLAKAFGSSQGAVTFPNAILYLRSGTAATYVQGTGAILITSGASPMAMVGFPGESATIDMSNSPTGSSTAGFLDSSSANDIFLQNLTITGGPSGTSNFRQFSFLNLNDRYTAHNISFPNVFAGTSTSDNASTFYWNDPTGTGSTTVRNYIYLKGVSETNRANSGSNSFGIMDVYKSQYGLVEFCSCTGNSGGYAFFLKASTPDWTRRCNTSVITSTGGYAFATFAQYNDVLTQNIEDCYNIVDASAVSRSQSITQNEDVFTPGQGQTWCYRNTLLNPAVVSVPTTYGPFNFDKNAIQYYSTPGAVLVTLSGGGWTATLPSNVTNTGTECQASTGVFNSDYTLTSAYSSYDGQRGAGIS